MNLEPITDLMLSIIIGQIRQYCPSLNNRVGGAAIYKSAFLLPENATMEVPAGYVVPLDDDAEAISQNGTRHKITDNFAVIVVISNKPDERGQQSATDAMGMRRELWRALVGFQPGSPEEYNGIHYSGKTLLKMDRSRAWWQYEFSVYHEIGLGGADNPETWQELQQSDPDKYPPFSLVHFGIDGIDPASDRNIQYPGPDGRIEFQFDINLPTDP